MTDAAGAEQDVLELPSIHYGTQQTSSAGSQWGSCDMSVAAAIAALCTGTTIYEYKGSGNQRHLRHFRIKVLATSHPVSNRVEQVCALSDPVPARAGLR